MFPFFSIILLIAALFSIGCSSPPSEAAPRKQAEAQPTVAVAKVARQDLGSDFDVVGEFRAYQEADLYAKVAGYLSKLNVDLGDSVREGQLLAILEVPELKQELEHAEHTEKRVQLETGRARGDVERAESMMKIREITFERIRSISEKRPNLIARQELDTAQAQYEESRGQLAAAQANLAAAEQQIQVSRSSRARIDAMLQYLRITAPFSGVVTMRYVFPGSLIQAGTSSATQAKPVVRISQINRLRLTIPVPESLISRLHIGQPLEIRVDTLKRVFQGKISRFSDSVDNSTRTMATEIDIPNQNMVLKPGMVAHVSIPVERKLKALTVPLAAVVERQGKPTVFVVSPEGNVLIQNVQRGLETADAVEILSGVQEGDLAITAGQNQLKAGLKVEPKLIVEGR